MRFMDLIQHKSFRIMLEKTGILRLGPCHHGFIGLEQDVNRGIRFRSPAERYQEQKEEKKSYLFFHRSPGPDESILNSQGFP